MKEIRLHEVKGRREEEGPTRKKEEKGRLLLSISVLSLSRSELIVPRWASSVQLVC